MLIEVLAGALHLTKGSRLAGLRLAAAAGAVSLALGGIRSGKEAHPGSEWPT
jgi:hypothetical protein